MIVSEIRETIVKFYRQSNKITLGFAVLMMCRVVGFLHVPSVMIYGGIIIYVLYLLSRGNIKYSLPLVLFLIYIPIQLVIINPDPIFKSWVRYGLFILLLICVSPLLISEKIVRYRREIFEVAVTFCLFLGVGSFFSKYLGINYMMSNVKTYVFGVGTFGGLTAHSMMLGPIAGIGAIYCCYRSFYAHKKLYWLLSTLCVCAVLFSASRSALVATIGGLTIAIYRLNGNVSKSIKTIVLVILVGSVTFSIWGSALDAVQKKNEVNIIAGSAYSSRENKWIARITEFKNSPVLGVGFDAIDLDLAFNLEEYDEETGDVEAGSSWLIIFSMTGLIGAIIIIPILISSFINAFKCESKFGGLVCGVLTLFYIHMIAEGYIYYAGSSLAFLLWLTIGVAHDTIYRKTIT